MTARNPKEPSGRGRQDEAATDGHVPPSGVAFVGHTPTPWSIIPGDLDDQDHGIDYVGIPEGFNPDHSRRHEEHAARCYSNNAPLIVRAVNAHAALVEALESALCYLHDEAVERAARAALKLARGES